MTWTDYGYYVQVSIDFFFFFAWLASLNQKFY